MVDSLLIDPLSRKKLTALPDEMDQILEPIGKAEKAFSWNNSPSALKEIL